ncbi:uncharacterized protein LOC128264024 [Drosophila gunungcola]|uniref:uncharacterized protein LOC128264024 n=1 Tax=Drosophila gunungcola TaxID=103775 RepID=UPI0022E91237|nr:uncharacterized protein LOC128264024 [Drosophila gunungcola]
MDEMLTSAWSGPVVFRGIHFRVGYLIIDCLDEGSAEWLKIAVPQLRTWKGVPLETRTGADIPAAYNATLFCPRSSDRTNEEILAFIGFQNRVETDAWKVISRKNDGAGALLVVGMDQTGRDEIVERDHKLNFRFGHVTVSGLKKTKRAPEETPNDGTCKAVEDTLEQPNVEPKSQSGEQDEQSITSMDIGDDQGDGHPMSSQELVQELLLDESCEEAEVTVIAGGGETCSLSSPDLTEHQTSE